MDVHLRALAERQLDVVSAWQLMRAGWTRTKIHHHARRGGWRRMHPGVYLLSSAPVTREQLWFAAALTTPSSFLSHGSAGACFGFYRFRKPFEVVTRRGNGGRRRMGNLVVCRSKLLEGETTTFMGIPITTAERVLVDIAPGLNRKRTGRALREGVRLKRTTTSAVLHCANAHPTGTAELRDLATRYLKLPYQRCRSDAEARGLEILFDAGRELPLVNAMVEGEEADYTWPGPKRIVEIDGPQYHRFRDEDARKAAKWRKAGYDVRRISSDAIYDSPAELVALCPYPAPRTFASRD
jgi:hypothetical protein